MKKLTTILIFLILILVPGCNKKGEGIGEDRVLIIDGNPISESEYGGVEKWYAYDVDSEDDSPSNAKLQIGYFNDYKFDIKELNDIAKYGFIIEGPGNEGMSAYFLFKDDYYAWFGGYHEEDNEVGFDFTHIFEYRVNEGMGKYHIVMDLEDGETEVEETTYRVRKY